MQARTDEGGITPVGKPRLAWLSCGLTATAALVYLVLAEPASGEAAAVVTIGGVLFLSSIASAAAALTFHRHAAMVLLAVAALPLLVLGFLALLTIGIVFLGIAGLLAFDLLSLVRSRQPGDAVPG